MNEMIQQLISKAIEDHVPLVIFYQKDTEVIQRLVIPTRMQGNIVKVYDQTKQAPRTFIIDHILAAEFKR